MTDRTVKVSLILAAQGYMSGMDAVQQKTAQTGTEIEKLNQKRQAFTSLGTAAVGFGAAAAAGVGLAISRFADFDQQMSFVQAATHETASNMNLLRDAALEAGARTVYSATEAAGAIEELAKAGVSTSDILSGGLDAALDLAAAGGLDVAQAAGIAATALKTFKLEGEDMAHVADLLAAGAGKAMGDVSELAQALAQGGQVAKSTGLSIEETTAGLAAFASEGLRGSDAGTSFKSMLQRLTPQSKEAEAEMKRLGISAYDAQGQFIGLTAFAGNLRDSLKSLTPEQRNAAMATIFGADAVRAATVLYNEGEAGIRDWISAVDDQGYAAETAAMRLDNLKGDVEQLGGALDTGLIQSGSGANDALRSLVQTATAAVNVFTGLPEPVQQAGVYLGLAAAAVGLVGGAALIATPRIAEFRAVVTAAGFSMKGLSLAAGGVTLGLGVVIAVVASLAQQQAEARAKAEAYANTLEAGTQRVTKATRDMVKEALAASNSFLWMEKDSAYDAADKLGISLDLVTDAAMGNSKALRELQKQIDEGADGSLAYANSAVDIENAVRGESASIEEAARAAAQKEKAERDGAAATAESADLNRDAASAYSEAAAASQDLTSQLADLVSQINEANGVGQDAITANAAYQEALAGINEEVARQRSEFEAANGTLEGFSLSLDQNTVSGSANAAMLADVARDAQTAAAAQFEVDRTTMSATDATEKYSGTLAAQRQAFIDSASAAGFNKGEVELLADQIFRLPSEKEVKILADTFPARNAINGVISDYQGRTITLRIGAQGEQTYSRDGGRTSYNASGNFYERGKVKEFRAGGFASGIYPATPGGIHKFAEAGHDEAFITMDPQYHDRSVQIWQEVGNRLAAFRSAPSYMAAPRTAPAEASAQLTVDQRGANFYSYDPHEVGRQSSEQLQRVLDAYGI